MDKIIFIKTVDGKTFKFKLGALDTIKDIKNKISKEKGIPIESQRIIFNGKILEDNKSLKQYNINHESILHLVPKLKDLSSSQSNNKNENLKIEIPTPIPILKKNNFYSNIKRKI